MSRITRREIIYASAAAGIAATGVRANRAAAQGGRRITIAAKPEGVSIDTAATAVIVVDMQNDFGAKGGMFERAGIDVSGIQKAVAPTARVLDAARHAGIGIVYLKMAYRPDLSDLGAPDSVNRIRHLRLGVGQTVHAPNGAPSRILVRDTWNTDILAELRPSSRRHCRLQDALQRILRHGFGRAVARARHPSPDRHRLHHEHLRRIDGSRRDVQGLRLRVCSATA